MQKQVLFKKHNFELDNASIHPTASISNDSIIGKNVSIGANSNRSKLRNW